MPQFDGTGPTGQGPRTGKVCGYCGRAGHCKAVHGFWGFRSPKNQRQALESEKEILEEELRAVNEELEALDPKTEK